MRKMGGRSASSTYENVASSVWGFKTWERRSWLCSERTQQPSCRPRNRPNEAEDESTKRKRTVRQTHCVSS